MAKRKIGKEGLIIYPFSEISGWEIDLTNVKTVEVDDNRFICGHYAIKNRVYTECSFCHKKREAYAVLTRQKFIHRKTGATGMHEIEFLVSCLPCAVAKEL